MVRLADFSDRHDGGASFAGQPGRLFLWFPVGLALRKVRRFLRRIDQGFASTPTGALAVDAPDGYPEQLIFDLADLLSEHESADTRCVFKPGFEDLDVDDIRRVRTVGELSHLRESAWLVDILRSDRLTSVFQPIVRADAPSNVFGHEALLRGIGHDGSTLSPGSLFDAARGCGMLPELDWAARRSAIRAASTTQDDRGQLFLNFTPEALRDGVEALAPTIVAIDEAEILRERVVFEVIEAEQAADLRHLRSMVDSVRGAGFRVALDDISCADHARRLVHEVRPDFIKLDMQCVRIHESGIAAAERLMQLAQQLKIETIAEGVETSDELQWNRERGATYVQGYYIGRPAALEQLAAR